MTQPDSFQNRKPKIHKQDDNSKTNHLGIKGINFWGSYTNLGDGYSEKIGSEMENGFRVLESEVTWRNRSEGETIESVYKFSKDSSSRTFGLLSVKLLAQGELANYQTR